MCTIRTGAGRTTCAHSHQNRSVKLAKEEIEIGHRFEAIGMIWLRRMERQGGDGGDWGSLDGLMWRSLENESCGSGT